MVLRKAWKNGRRDGEGEEGRKSEGEKKGERKMEKEGGGQGGREKAKMERERRKFRVGIEEER